MTDIGPYVRVLYVRHLVKGAFGTSFVRRHDILANIERDMREMLAGYQVEDRVDVGPIADSLLEELISHSAFTELADDFAGFYYKPVPNNIENFRQSFLPSDAIHHKADAIGEKRYFSDVFNGYAKGETGEPIAGVASISVPASDRIVTVSHNQRTLVEPALDALIDDVRGDNEEFEGDVKARLLGQMRAGRELIQSGSVRAYLLYHTLIRGLIELVARYRGRAIAIAAEKLIEILVEQFFQS